MFGFLKSFLISLALVLSLNAVVVDNVQAAALQSSWHGMVSASAKMEGMSQAPTSKRHILLSDVGGQTDTGLEACDDISDGDDFLGELYCARFRFFDPFLALSLSARAKALRSHPLAGESEPPESAVISA